MRPHGSGSVYKTTKTEKATATRPERKRTYYVGEVVVAGKRRRVTGRTKTEASAKLRALIEESHKRPTKTRTRKTVGSIVEAFLARLDPAKLAPSTMEVHRWAAAIIVDEIGPAKISELRVADVEDFLADLAGKGYGRASLVKIRSTLSQALKAAVRREEILANPAASAELPAATPTKKRRSLTRDEAARFLDAAREDRLGLCFALMLRLGLRPGEATGLYWSDVTDGLVNVTRAVRSTKGRVEVVDELKTSSSRRTIALPDDLVAWLDDHAAATVAEDRGGDDRLVFATSTGTPIEARNLRRALDELTARAGVTAVTPNELRHSCASLLSDAGVSNEEIADLLGHTTTRMVDRTYRHRLRPVIDVADRIGL